MSKIDDGGAAFPFEYDAECHSGRTVRLSCSGLTKREYFAAAALTGLVFSNVSDCLHDNQSAERYAEDAFCIADAMIAASKSGGSDE